MIGALLGDMIGAPYEFDRGAKTKDFPLFSRHSGFTDDTVMTIAVAEALLDTLGQSDESITAALVASMQKWGRYIRMPDTAVCSSAGCMKRIRSPMAASVTALR